MSKNHTRNGQPLARRRFINAVDFTDVCGCGLRSLLDGSFSLPDLIDLRADDNLIEAIDVATKAPSYDDYPSRGTDLVHRASRRRYTPSSLSHLDLQGNP